METTTVRQRPRKRLGPTATFFLVAGLLLLLVVLLGIAYVGSIVHRGSVRMKRELARVRATGAPVTPAELNRHYQLPPGAEDTTELWVEACDVLTSDQFGADAAGLPIVGTSQASIPPPGQPWGELDAAEQLVEKYRRPLGLMHRAAERGGAARYPVDFTTGALLQVQHVQKLRGGARALALEAHVRAHRGDAHGAAESIRTGLALGRSVQREPVLVSMLVRIACDSVAQSQLEGLLHSVDFSDEDLRALQEELRKVDHRENLREALIGERVLGISLFEDPTGTPGGSKGGMKMTLWKAAQSEGMALYLEHLAKLIAAADKPWPEALQEARAAEAQLRQLQNASFATRMRYTIASLAGSAISAAIEASARGVATNRAADAALACERYRLKHGSLPKSLEQLVAEFLPEVPRDPYSGEPLRYIVRDDEYLVYSVGSDGVDEGGLVADGTGGDHPFRVGPPPETEEASQLDAAGTSSDEPGTP